MKTNKVLLIYTGGTIGMGRNKITGALEPLDFHHLINALPEFEQIETGVDVHQFAHPIDSSDVSPKEWASLVRIIRDKYDFYDGFVILHGTDTMAYTASALSFMLENLTKPVILTGSQLPMGQLRTDGKENLITSLEFASAYYLDDDNGKQVWRPRVPEVCIYFNGKLLRGNRSTKCSADEFNAFNSFNYTHLADAGVDFVFHDHHILKPDFSKTMTAHVAMNPDIVVFSLFPGIQETMVRHILLNNSIRGIVMRTFGSGNAPQQPWLRKLIREASERGTVIVNVSQCLAGTVEMARYGTGYHLLESGVISGRDITVESATTKLMYLLARYNDANVIRRLMGTNIAGEIS